MDFYSHASCEARHQFPGCASADSDFYSHAPCGARQEPRNHQRSAIHFYSHAPCGARRKQSETGSGHRKFLLTRPMRGATNPIFKDWAVYDISTHTPHAGRDKISSRSITDEINFYSHAPCGARHRTPPLPQSTNEFLLTRPMRGATSWFLAVT